MAKIHSETIVVTINRLIKDRDEVKQPIANAEILAALTQVVEELVGAGVVVEIEVA
jgi:hypothetical protein